MLPNHSATMPSESPANTTSACSMWLRDRGLTCEPEVIPSPTQTKLPDEFSALITASGIRQSTRLFIACHGIRQQLGTPHEHADSRPKKKPPETRRLQTGWPANRHYPEALHREVVSDAQLDVTRLLERERTLVVIRRVFAAIHLRQRFLAVEQVEHSRRERQVLPCSRP